MFPRYRHTAASASPDVSPQVERTESRRPRRQRSDWRNGGVELRRWDSTTFALAAVGFGLGLMGEMLVMREPGVRGPTSGPYLLWLGLLGAVIASFLRGQPAGLLKFRPSDLLWGCAIGLCLRVAQGLATGVNTQPFPRWSEPLALHNPGDVLAGAVPLLIFGPLIEELFFRGIVAVSLFGMFQRWLGASAASVVSVISSSIAFALLHYSFAMLSFADGISLLLVGIFCGASVFFSGRIWGALLAHVVYNAGYVTLAVAGSLLTG